MIKRYLSELKIYICNHIISSFPSRRLRYLYYTRIMGYCLHPSSAIHMGARFYCSANLSVGRNSVVNDNCRLDSRGGLRIKSNVFISSEVIILTATHDPRSLTFAGIRKPVLIEDFAWIGVLAIILPGVTIGKGAVVAAGDVVTKSVDAGTTVAGVPAKEIAKGRVGLSYQLDYRRLFH